MAVRPLEHTADLGIEVVAATLDELFAEAARGLCDTLTEAARVVPQQRQRLQLAAAAPDLLLVDFLQELLFHFDARGELLPRCAVEVVERAGEWRLAADCAGERFDAARHPLGIQVKAVTYHGLEVVRAEGGWRARVIFDI